MEAYLGIAGPHVRDTALLFAALLSIPFGDRYPKLTPNPAQQRRRTFTVLLNHFENLARQKPIVLLFEDGQWADATSLELVDLAVERVRQLPVLALFTGRPDFEPPWVGLPNVSTLTLGRLDRNTVESIVTQVTGGLSLPTEVMNQIVAKTDGNPLFVEELTKAVIEGNILVKDADGYRLDGPLPPLAIPTTLQELVDGATRPPRAGEGGQPNRSGYRTRILVFLDVRGRGTHRTVAKGCPRQTRAG